MSFALFNSPDQTSGVAPPRHRTGAKRRGFMPALVERLTGWREASLLRQALALAGQPNSILDIPCGTGRLWPILLEKSNRLLIGADDCADMLTVAKAAFPTADNTKIRYLKTAPETINLHDSAVDCIFCVRMFPGVGNPAHRQQILQEFHRVTRDTLILSLWVDGNLQSWRRQAALRQTAGGQEPPARHVVARQQIEVEFDIAGFDLLGRLDMLPLCRMARTYVLRKR